MTWKITPTLYNAWRYYAFPKFDRTDEQEVEARAEFIRILRKEKTDVTPKMQHGIDFENEIMGAAERIKLENETGIDQHGLVVPPRSALLSDADIHCARYIGALMYDGEFQVKDGRELPSGNYIYGVADCILLNGIVDFKRLTQYEQDKYKDSIQHWAYMYIWQMDQFYYYIGAGDMQPYIESYCWFDGAEGVLEARISEMIFWINQDPELREIFAEFWTYNKAQQ